MDRNLALEMARVTEPAALASACWMGKADGHAASATAVETRQSVFYSIYFDPKGVKSNRGRDLASMLYIGERIGAAKSTNAAEWPVATMSCWWLPA